LPSTTQVPFFFEDNLPATEQFTLREESSKHIVQVLRMGKYDQLLITNGKGQALQAFIVAADKKKTTVEITERNFRPQNPGSVSIAVSLVKNKDRFEWFLEKATELGVAEIIPLICRRTEKQHFKYDRMKNILVSAMLQSQQVWLPLLSEPVKFTEIIKRSSGSKFIAHCMEGEKKQLTCGGTGQGDQLILIGPEGDFTKDEIDMAARQEFVAVRLADTRLRTETAAIVAAVLLLNK
jgi:16S rRNA (uracil1498-N3)-methyltransferase